MTLIKPTFSDPLAGASYSRGQALPSADVNTILANERLAHMRGVMNWIGFAYPTLGGGLISNTRRAIFCGASNSSDGAMRPLWATYADNGSSEMGFASLPSAVNAKVSVIPSSGKVGGLVGVQTGTKQGLWQIDVASPKRWDTSTSLPFGGSSGAIATQCPIVTASESCIFAGAFKSVSGTHARVIAVGSGSRICLTDDDGASWTSRALSSNWQMAAASPSMLAAVTGSALYAGATIAGLAAVAGFPIAAPTGITYDPYWAQFIAWGQGIAYSTDGTTWRSETNEPGALITTQFGCSDDGTYICTTTGNGTPAEVWASFDGGHSWVFVTRFGDTEAITRGDGLIGYGGGIFGIAANNGLYFSNRVAF